MNLIINQPKSQNYGKNCFNHPVYRTRRLSRRFEGQRRQSAPSPVLTHCGQPPHAGPDEPARQDEARRPGGRHARRRGAHRPPGQWQPQDGSRHPHQAPALSESTQVTITGPDGAEIRYTTDGSTPTAESTLYSEPFTLTNNTRVKAIAIKNGVTSPEATKYFTHNTVSDGE
ncbi:MAG: chitobiase/beta-hexosaminidase C-terminal domain-containing protein [Bacteroidales bacterium]|nr:chitobiase/beta-hexosaminidase C-terminal domain-containing protein [Bacteroidales bacterium]MBQ6101080.1 chitobiase/beta-hexosaminidase C-terminal domain-containing protein [Bacteroidales bacterium]